MQKVRVVMAAVAIALVIAVAGPAAAAKPTSLYYFYDCAGEADAPSSFYAVKTALPSAAGQPVAAAAAFLLTDGSATYSVLVFGEGLFDPPGIRSHSESYNLVCNVVLGGVEQTVYGVYSPTP